MGLKTPKEKFYSNFTQDDDAYDPFEEIFVVMNYLDVEDANHP